ncbi:MAG: hypothetical protein M1816_001398 [Peltula sp. TS41687]|nr:MAG: hypothetical protein M1816_001398 [Peltula sp. TS41687]
MTSASPPVKAIGPRQQLKRLGLSTKGTKKQIGHPLLGRQRGRRDRDRPRGHVGEEDDGITGSALDRRRKDNQRGLLVLEELEEHKSRLAIMEDRMAKQDFEIANLKGDVASLKLSMSRDILKIRNRFFSTYRRDVAEVPLSQSDYQAIHEGDILAHHGDPITDARLYEENLRFDDEIFTALYGLHWTRGIIRNNSHPYGYATAKADREKPIEASVEEAFTRFIDALQAERLSTTYMQDSDSQARFLYWAYWSARSQAGR